MILQTMTNIFSSSRTASIDYPQKKKRKKRRRKNKTMGTPTSIYWLPTHSPLAGTVGNENLHNIQQ